MMPDIIEYAEKHKDQTIKMLRELESKGDSAMKSNKVRMNISREMHERFMTIDGNTNDERMRRVIEVNDGYKELLENYTKRELSLLSTMQTSHRYQELYYKSRNNNRILKGLLGLSMAVSIISASYLSHVQGWFL